MTKNLITHGFSWLLLALAVCLTPAASSAAGTIKGKAWNDLNADGLQQAGEFGMGTVWVQVETGTGGWVNGGYTDMAGLFEFTNIPAGTYRVKFANPGNGFNQSPQNVGTNDAIDSDPDIYGYTANFTLADGQTSVQDGGFNTAGGCYTPVTAVVSNIASNGQGGFTFQITAAGGTSFGGQSWGWDYPGGSLMMIPYGTAQTVGPFPCTGPASVTINDHDNPYCTTTVTVQPPANCGGSGPVLTMTCPVNMTATAATGQTSAVVNYPAPTASTTCAGGAVNVTRTSGPASGTAFPVGTTQVCYSASDNCGNVKTCCFSVTVNPEGGTPTCTTITVTASGNTITIGFLSAPVVSIQVFNAAWTQVFSCWDAACTKPTTTIPNLAAGTYYYKIDYFTAAYAPICTKDGYITVPGGNTSTLTMTCPVDMNVTAAAGQTSAVVNYTNPTATSTCTTGAVSVVRTSGPASGSAFPVGTTQVCFSATDGCGNVKTCCFNVTVNVPVGTTLTLTCPVDMTVTAAVGQNSAVVNYNTPTATTTCAGGAVNIVRTSGPASGSTVAVGTTQICHTATDNCGNVKTCCFNVTVQPGSTGNDCTAITVTASGNTITVGNLNAPIVAIQVFNAAWVQVFNCWDAACTKPTTTIPNLPAGVYYYKVDYYTAAYTPICTKDGYITVPGGNTSTLTMTCPVDMSVTAAVGQTTAIVTYPTPTATTTCAGGAVNITRTSGPASGSAMPVGTTTICHQATDNCGNVKTCCFTVTVNPAPPTTLTMTCPVDMTVTAAVGQTSAVVNYTTPTATTTCPGGAVNIVRTSGPASGSSVPVGTTIICHSATDNCGNAKTCCFTVTVNAAPPTTLTMTCPVDMSVTAAVGQNTAIVTYPTPTATTTCPGGAVTITRTSGPASGSVFPVGTTTVCHKATDNCGNVKTCCFTVTVKAPNACTTPPIIKNCPANIVATANTGATCATVNWTPPTINGRDDEDFDHDGQNNDSDNDDDNDGVNDANDNDDDNDGISDNNDDDDDNDGVSDANDNDDDDFDNDGINNDTDNDDDNDGIKDNKDDDDDNDGIKDGADDDDDNDGVKNKDDDDEDGHDFDHDGQDNKNDADDDNDGVNDANDNDDDNDGISDNNDDDDDNDGCKDDLDSDTKNDDHDFDNDGKCNDDDDDDDNDGIKDNNDDDDDNDGIKDNNDDDDDNDGVKDDDDDNDGSPCDPTTLVSTYNPGFCFPVGTTTVKYTATNAAGLTSVCIFTVTVNPPTPCTTPPVIKNCPANIVLTASNGAICAPANWTPPTINGRDDEDFDHDGQNNDSDNDDDNDGVNDANDNDDDNDGISDNNDDDDDNDGVNDANDNDDDDFDNDGINNDTDNDDDNDGIKDNKDDDDDNDGIKDGVDDDDDNDGVKNKDDDDEDNHDFDHDGKDNKNDDDDDNDGIKDNLDNDNDNDGVSNNNDDDDDNDGCKDDMDSDTKNDDHDFDNDGKCNDDDDDDDNDGIKDNNDNDDDNDGINDNNDTDDDNDGVNDNEDDNDGSPCDPITLVSTYNPGFCFPIGTTTVKYTATNAGGLTSICTFTVTVNPPSTCNNVTGGGTIGTAQTICSGTIPATLTNVAAPSGGSGTLEYMWLSSTTACPNNANQGIAGAMSATYSPPALTASTWYVRCARRAPCTDWTIGESNCVKITVNACPPVTCTSNNLFCNTSFESNWSCFSNMGTTSISTVAHTGAQSGKICSANGLICQKKAGTSGSYTFSAWTKCDAGGSGYIYILYENSAGGVLGQSSKTTFSGNTTWTQYTVSGSAPAGCVTVRCEVVSNSSTCIRTDDWCLVKTAGLVAQNSSLAFSAARKDFAVQLKWLANTGKDAVSHYIVERSTNGADFENIGLVNDAGNANETHFFDFADKKPVPGTDNTYRIQQVFQNGTERASDAQIVFIPNSLDGLLFPNPTTNEVYVNLAQFAGRTVEVAFVSQVGTVVLSSTVAATETAQRFDLGRLASGFYTVLVTADGSRQSAGKLVVSNY